MKNMSLGRLVNNPAGDSPSLFSNTKLNEHFKGEFNEYKRGNGSGIKFTAVKINKLQFIRLLMPSAAPNTSRNYDVVFKINHNPKVPLSERSIQVFSNVPSFTYTYAKVFKERGYLVNELIDLYPSKVFTESTGYRNRLMTEEAPKGFVDRVKMLTGMQSNDKIWFDRYLFYAAQFVLTNNVLLDDINYKKLSDVRELNKLIVQPLRPIESISSEKRLETANKKSSTKQIFKGSEGTGYKETNKTSSAKGIEKSNNISASNKIGRSKKVGQVKRIGKK